MTEQERVDWKALPLREAWPFGSAHGAGKEVSDIRNMDIEWDRPYTTSVKRGYVVALFQEKGLFDAFKTACWENGNTRDGATRVRRYLRLKQEYEEFLAGGGQTESAEEDEETESDQEFAAESDLRDFLADNLHVLEPGLIPHSEGQSGGLEYPAGAQARIDILAKDQDGRFVVIELKVSRGRYAAVGQILYYMGWVDEHLAPGRKCRGIIVAKEISDDLVLACQRIPDVSLYKYNLAVNTVKVYPPAS